MLISYVKILKEVIEMTKKLLAYFLSFTLLGSVMVTTPMKRVEASSTRSISATTYYDKTLAMILGQCGGLATGFEFLHQNGEPWIAMPDSYFSLLNGTIGGSTIEYNYAARDPQPGLFLSDDDIHIDFFNQHIIDEHGPFVTAKDIKDEWLYHDVYDWAGGDFAKRIMTDNNVMPPYTGKIENGNTFYWCTEAYIESETLGADFPGMPQTAYDYAQRFTDVVGDFDSSIWGRWWAALYAQAYFETDARTALQDVANVLPNGSWPKEIYDKCLQLRDQYPNDWRSAVRVIYNMGRKLYRINDTMVYGDINNGFGILAILYGNNDYIETLKIASLAGCDGDCTAASVGGLMGIIKGMSGTPQEIKDQIYLNGNGVFRNDFNLGAHINANYPTDQKIIDLAALYQRNAEKLISAYGGNVDAENYYIPVQQVSSNFISIQNYGFETGNLTGWKTWSSSGNDTIFAENQTADNGSTMALTGSWKGTAVTNSAASEAKLYVTVTGLKPGVTYRVDAGLYSSSVYGREVRLFAENYGGQYVYTSAVTNINYYYNPDIDRPTDCWAHRWVYFTLGPSSTSADIGLHLPATSSTERWGCIDNITLQEVSDYQQGTRYEAENSVITNSSVRNTESASGGSYVGGIDYSDSSLQIDNVYCNLAGEYMIRVNYANGGHYGLQKLYVNGEYIAKVYYPATAAWGVFSKNIVEVAVPLKAGNNTVKLEYDTNNAEVDYIEVAPLQNYIDPALAIKSGTMYKIIAKCSGKVLEVAGQGTANGNNIQQYSDYGGILGQVWFIVDAGGGYYKLVNANSGKVADVENSSTIEGANVSQYTDSGTPNQQWSIQSKGNGYFKIINRNSGKVLDVSGGATNDGANVRQWTDLNNDAQSWKLEILSSNPVISGGTYKVRAKCSGKLLEVAGASTENGANVQQWAEGDSWNNQRWTIWDTGEGYYKFINVYSGKALDVENYSTEDGANVSQYTDSGTTNQQWKIEYKGNGTFKLTAKNSGKCLNVAEGGTADGVNVNQMPDAANDAQSWMLEFVGK